MKHLDLFCGYGGWTKGFLKEGFESTGIDNNPKTKSKYPGKFILANLEDYLPKGNFDVITASPPCTEFSIAKKFGWGTQNEMKGLDLVYRAFNIIQTLKPKYWIIENVKGIEQFLGEPKQKIRYNNHPSGKYAYLYGNFPELGMFESQIVSVNHDKIRDPNLRGEIPFPLSIAMAKSIKKELEKSIIKA